MTKRILFTLLSLVIWLVALALIIILAVERYSAPPWGNSEGDQLSVEISGDTRVGQRFTAPLPGLFRIDVALVPGQKSTDARIVFHLQDPSAAQDLWTEELRADEIPVSEPYRAIFTPMRDSQGQTLYFFFEPETSLPGEAIAARYSPTALLPDANMYVDDQPVAGNLQFQTYYALRTGEKVDLLLGKMAEGKPYLLGSRGFYVGLFATYVLLMTLFVLLITQCVFKGQVKES